MNYVNAKIAREARLHRSREKLWGQRYRGIVVSDEPEAEVERLRYLLSQGSMSSGRLHRSFLQAG